MCRIKSLLVSLLSIACFCNIATGQPTPSTIRTKPAKVKTPDLEAAITVSDAPTVLDCPLTVTIRNIGSLRLVLTDYLDGAYSSEISLESPSKERCPYTPLGKSVSGSGMLIGSAFRKSIDPGSTFTFTLPLENFFQLKAGTWRLTFKLKIDNTATDCSVELPKLEFTLAGKP